MNRRVAIHSIHDGNMGTLADVRRGDIFQRNESLSAFIKISNCKNRHFESRKISLFHGDSFRCFIFSWKSGIVH